MTYALFSYACDLESMVYAKIIMQDLAIILKTLRLSLPHLPVFLQQLRLSVSTKRPANFWMNRTGMRLLSDINQR